MNSESAIISIWLILKQRLTQLVVVFCLQIIYRVLWTISSLRKLQLQVQFRNLLAQLSFPHLLKDMVGQDANKVTSVMETEVYPIASWLPPEQLTW